MKEAVDYANAPLTAAERENVLPGGAARDAINFDDEVEAPKKKEKKDRPSSSKRREPEREKREKDTSNRKKEKDRDRDRDRDRDKERKRAREGAETVGYKNDYATGGGGGFTGGKGESRNNDPKQSKSYSNAAPARKYVDND